MEFAKTLNKLAKLYKEQGDYTRAEPLCSQASEIRKKILGENHPDYAAVLNDLARLHQDRGDYAGAEPLARQAVETIRRHTEAMAVVESNRQQLSMLQSERKYLDDFLGLTAISGHGIESAYREMLAWKGIVLRRQGQIRTGTQSPELAASFQQLQRVATQLSRLSWTTPEPKQEAERQQRLANLSALKERLEAKLVAQSNAYQRAKQQVTLEQVQAALPGGAMLVDFLEYARQTAPRKATDAQPANQRLLLAFVVSHDHPPEMISLGAVQPLSEAIDSWRMTFGMSPQGTAAGNLLREKIWQPIEAKLRGARIVLLSPDGALARLPFTALPGKEAGKYLIEEYTLAVVPVPQMIPELLSHAGHRELQKNLLLMGNVDYDAAPPQGAETDRPGQFNSTKPGTTEKVRLAAQSSRQRGAQGAHFDSLPATREEIVTIEKMYRQVGFSGEGLTTLERSRANKATFRTEMARHRYVHLATHGFFLSEKQLALGAAFGADRLGENARGSEMRRINPGLLSGLALAGANRAGRLSDVTDPDADDGILTAEEIGSMNLDGVQLVMLSACETGLGKAAGGEGLLGLQRAFQSAGARTVVASLWSVPDIETRMLMEEFYTNLWTRKLGALESLRRAQLVMLRGDGKAGQLRGVNREDQPDEPSSGKLSPRYWAAFVLSGDWR